MLSSEERWLIAGVLALLLFGGVVKMCREHVTEKDVEKIRLPSVDSTAKTPMPLQGLPKSSSK